MNGESEEFQEVEQEESSGTVEILKKQTFSPEAIEDIMKFLLGLGLLGCFFSFISQIIHFAIGWDYFYIEQNVRVFGVIYYRPVALQLLNVLTVASSICFVFSAVGFWLRYRNPVAILTFLSFLLTISFNVTWAATIPLYLEEWLWQGWFPAFTLVFPQEELMWAFVNDVAWGMTSYLISHVFLGLAFFHTMPGERKTLNFSQMILGSFIMCMSIIGIMVPHLGFLVYQGLSHTWLQVSMIWVALAQFMAILAYILLFRYRE